MVGTALVRQAGSQPAVHPRSAQGGHPHDRHHADAGAEQGEHRTGAGPDQRPAETEQDASGHVADARAQHLWGNDGRRARQGEGPAREERQPRGRHGERGGEYFVEVRALEAQCLLDAEPGRQLPLGQHDPEQDAHAEVGAEQALPVLRGRGSHGRGGGHRGTSSGSRKTLAAAPAAKNEITEMSEAACRSASPEIPWPDVQPPAHDVPNPTRKPPPTIMSKPRTLRRTCQVNSCRGTSPVKSRMPSAARDACAWGVMAAGSGFASSTPPRKPPATTPATKTRFHRPRERQSYLKNSTLPGKVAAQMWRRLAERPNGLLPIASNATATTPTSGPVTYQGHGLSRNGTIGLLQDRHDRPRRTTAGHRYGFRGRNSRSW